MYQYKQMNTDISEREMKEFFTPGKLFVLLSIMK